MSRRDERRVDWGSFAKAEEEAFEAALAATPAQRLQWLEDMRALAAAAGAWGEEHGGPERLGGSTEDIEQAGRDGGEDRRDAPPRR